MSITEKYKGKIIKKVSNTGVPKEEYNALTTQVVLLEAQVNELTTELTGKQLVADAIGNPLITADSTFQAMSEAITTMYNTYKDEINFANSKLENAYCLDPRDGIGSYITVHEQAWVNIISFCIF